jgi:hypothetical protein
MTTRALMLAAILAASTTAAGAASTIASTSFEEQAVFDGVQYVDTLDPATDHALLDNDGEPVVNYTSVGGELGFSSFYTNTRNGAGLSDGDFVGVTDFTGVVDAYTDGTQGFQIGDPDGLMTVTLDTVDLTGFDNTSVSVDVFVQSTSYESDDRIRVWVAGDGGVIDLLNTAGSDIDDLGIEDMWSTLTADLSGFTAAALLFEIDSNSGSEAIFVDNVVFSGDATVIPVPAAAWLMLSGLAALGLRRRA